MNALIKVVFLLKITRPITVLEGNPISSGSLWAGKANTNNTLDMKFSLNFCIFGLAFTCHFDFTMVKNAILKRVKGRFFP